MDTQQAAPPAPNAAGEFAGVILIDGVRATAGEMRSLDRSRIETIEVFKGQSGVQYYEDPHSANGVIAISTKPSRSK